MKKVVTIGGGTGSYTLLSGIKNIPNIEISAIVAMTDDGGSTGVLRDELGVLPAGDVRQCLIALSEQSYIVRKLMSYRFSDGGLAGHNFGNIFLAGLEKVTGSFMSGVGVASDILKVKGKVIPVTDSVATLHAILSNGSALRGENTINHAHFKEHTIQELYIDESVSINPQAKNAIEDADYIVIGPGNHYCSILPSLITPGVTKALKESAAKIIYIPNLTNKKGHTLGWNVNDYVSDIESYIGKSVDIIIINNDLPSEEQMLAYKLREGGGVLVENTIEGDSRIIAKSLISHQINKFDTNDSVANTRSFIRHHPNRLEKVIAEIIQNTK